MWVAHPSTNVVKRIVAFVQEWSVAGQGVRPRAKGVRAMGWAVISEANTKPVG